MAIGTPFGEREGKLENSGFYLENMFQIFLKI